MECVEFLPVRLSLESDFAVYRRRRSYRETYYRPSIGDNLSHATVIVVEAVIFIGIVYLILGVFLK